MGISPHQYVIQQRVQRAKTMLAKTDLAIADISFKSVSPELSRCSRGHIAVLCRKRSVEIAV
jgi:transcriptional regulator GlxA family with amidase domain